MLYDSNYMTLWKRQNDRDNKGICQELGEGGVNRQNTEDF